MVLGRYGRRTAACVPLLALIALLGAGEPSASASRPAGRSPGPESSLPAALLQAVERLHFDEVADYWTGRPIAAMPSIDLAVIELTATGAPRAAANVLFNRFNPDGVVVTLDDMRATGVRWRLWDQGRWDKPSVGPASDRRRSGPRSGPIEFMSPFPASILKLMVGFGILRLVDSDEVALETVRDDLDAMLTRSDNSAAMRLIALLHGRDAVGELNRTFAELGLGTLRLSGTDPDTGGHWTEVRMTALDTARMLLIISGAPGTLWQAPGGEEVTADVLSPGSRSYFYRLLSQQGLNHALSTTNFCGRAYPPSGIPQVTSARWTDTDGSVTVGGRRYGREVSPCNAAAEVTFAHKTGWTTYAGGDAGIVHSLAGRPSRDYIVVLLSNLGARFGDTHQPRAPRGSYPFPYTGKLPELGRLIDDIMTTRRNRPTVRAEILR